MTDYPDTFWKSWREHADWLRAYAERREAQRPALAEPATPKGATRQPDQGRTTAPRK